MGSVKERWFSLRLDMFVAWVVLLVASAGALLKARGERDLEWKQGIPSN